MRNGRAARAEPRTHVGSHAGGSVGLATAGMTGNGSTHATVGVGVDQMPLNLPSRKGEALGIWRLRDSRTI